MKPTTVQLFATCIIETLRPEAGMAVVEVLERLGLTIEYPEGQTCCGQPAFNGGLWDDAPRKLLSRVQGLEVADLPGATECCGFGGLFALKMSDISGAMLNRKLDNVESSGAQCVVGCDVSCLLNIGGGLHRRGAKIETKHLAELLTNDER